jgi:hypothetical protein
MTSLTPTIQAKSNQMNAEDLLGGPRTVTVTRVDVDTTSEAQPVAIHFEGDNGKPFKPCKTVRRILVKIWGDDSANFPGRSMTLYNDPEVTYGGMKVGGIRVSHASHIDETQTFYLARARGKKAEIKVKPLQSKPSPRDIAERIKEAMRGKTCMSDLQALIDHSATKKAVNDLPFDLQAELESARQEVMAQFETENAA